MIDTTKEKLISLKEACTNDPRLRAQQARAATLSRWARAGLRCGRGFVKLEVIRIGKKKCTTFESITRFLNALQNNGTTEPATASGTA